MSRAVRRVLIVAAVLAGLLVLAAVALPFVVDVNRYRPLIVDRVKEATGRTINLGTVSFRLLPAPGLWIGGPIAVSDSSAYPGRSALTAESLTVRLSLAGLLRGRASITSFTLQKPTVTLIRDARGRWNFDDLIERATAAPQRPQGARAERDSSSVLFIKEARISAGRLVVYDDAVLPGRRMELVIAPVESTIRGWGGEEPALIDLTAGLGSSVIESHGRLRVRGQDPRLEMGARGTGLRAEDFTPLLPWLGVARPPGLQVSGAIDLDGSADLPIEHPETLRFKGSLDLKGLSYKDAGMALPLKDLSGHLSVDGDRAVWKDFRVSTGSSSLRGGLQIENFMRPRIGFNLSSPRLDLNEMIATLLPAGPGGTPVTATAPAGAPPPTTSSGLLDQISGAGRLDVKAVRFQTFDLADVRSSVTLAKSVVALADLAASFYGGALKGRASVDLSQAVPRYAVAARLDKVDVGPALAAYDPSLKDLLRGRFTGTLDLGAGGSAMDRILKTAGGTGRIEITDGVLTSFSVLKQLAALLELAGGKGIGRENTPFEILKAGLSITDGRARTDDLTLHSADLDLEGKGWVGLDATLDLDVIARFSEASTQGMVQKNSRLAAFTENGRLVVHFGLKGNLASPAFRLNTRAQAGTVQEKAVEKLRERVKDQLFRRLGQPREPAPSEPEATPTPGS